MALQSAISSAPLEKFSTDEEVMEEDGFTLRLSDGEDEDVVKNEEQKTENVAPVETEDEILNKYETADPEIDATVDEDILLSDKQDDASKKSDNVEKALADRKEENEDKEESKKEEEKDDNYQEKVVQEQRKEVESNDIEREKKVEDEKKAENNMEVEEEKETEKLDTSVESSVTLPDEEDAERMVVDETEEASSNNNSLRLLNLDSVTKDLKDTVDTEDLLQVTSVKEADAANDVSSSSSTSSEKDDSEEMVDPSVDDSNERDDDNDDLIDRPCESLECTEDILDIEENNPLGVEVSEEMDKDYENLLNSEKQNQLCEELEAENVNKENNLISHLETVDSSKTEKIVCNSDASILESDKPNKKISVADDKSDFCESNENENKATESVTDKNAENPLSAHGLQSFVQNGICEKREEYVSKSVKRSLSECETEIGSKKIRLTESQVPTEQKLAILQTLTDFMKSKSLKKLTRRNLEEFCVQKICEVLVHKSEIGELRHQLQTQEQMMEFWKKESTAMSKQVKDLEIVNKKMLNELKLRQDKDAPPVPVKITRSVGLQVKLESVSSKRMVRTTSDVLQANTASSPTKPVAVNSAIRSIITKPVSPQVARQIKETPAPTLLSTTLLSQALSKVATPLVSSTSGNNSNNTVTSSTPGAEAKGVIDLTDEDDKTPSTTATNSTIGGLPHVKAQATTMRATTAGIAIVASKPPTTGAVTGSTSKIMYVLQPSPQLTQSTDLSKPGGTKSIMLRLQNSVIGSPNGFLPTLQSGPNVSTLAQTSLRPGQVRLQAPSPASVLKSKNPICHPAPLPLPPTAVITAARKPIPPKPQLSIRKSGQGIVLSWKLPYSLDKYEAIASYQLYAYQETSSPPSTDMWRKVGDVKALALPMACTLTQFADGNKYYFAVRAVDVFKRIGPFSDPEPISL